MNKNFAIEHVYITYWMGKTSGSIWGGEVKKRR